MYYRVAIQVEPSPLWQWKSTVLSSLDALFQYLRLYRALPQDRLRVFFCSSREEMNEQIRRENKGVSSTSVTAAQFLQERMIGSREGVWGATAYGTQLDERRTPIALATELALSESRGEAQILHEKGVSSLDKRRLEVELGVGGDHDVPYAFALPSSMPQVLAWMRLLTTVHRGNYH